MDLNFQDVMSSRLKKLDVSVQNLEVMQKLNAKQYLGPTTYVSLTHQQHRSWFLRTEAMLYSVSITRLSSVCWFVRHGRIVVKRCEIEPKLLS